MLHLNKILIVVVIQLVIDQDFITIPFLNFSRISGKKFPYSLLPLSKKGKDNQPLLHIQLPNNCTIQLARKGGTTVFSHFHCSVLQVKKESLRCYSLKSHFSKPKSTTHLCHSECSETAILLLNAIIYLFLIIRSLT